MDGFRRMFCSFPSPSLGMRSFIVPTLCAHRYTQVRASRKSSHFGRDAEIQAMDGNKSVVQMLDSGNMPYRRFMFAVAVASVVPPSLPSLDAGFRHPCRNDGLYKQMLELCIIF
ncbi:MAG: hypothetical protein DM484_00850 [Candidatus Methylumidiphilus alinenensis]|uniref:Uncharacterized protein n=1 Tax=Candidatus Methylumidiphilus alinenensis TaxID=2202197 RepID=A0A2W4RYY8_9GAMM|nr:MAG: hypothetical protein DM484_00850 [Candidatus Methylumidiphilus alinenensis]